MRQSRLALFATPLLASLPALAAHAAGAAIQMSPAAQTAKTKSYEFKLSIGMPEKMWTPAQVKSKHPTSGEVMLSGSMGGAMSMGGAARHLEVHITSRSSGKVVSGAHPSISAIDTSVKDAMTIKVAVAAMEGVSAGAADLHYGNNVHLIAGHTYRITVTLNGERAVFRDKVASS
jgi:hypothetical protein